MTDQHLHDLLHDTVSDVTAPDWADGAWRSGVRARGRRRAAVAVGATAAAAVVVGALALVGHGPTRPGPSTGPPSPASTSPSAPGSPYVPGDGSPDTHYAGMRVWWAPTLAQEAHLPAYPDSPLPATIDVGAGVAALTEHPLSRAVAAFAGRTDGISLEYLVVLAPDGRQYAVDTSRVRPMTDPEGNARIDVSASTLSPSGEYLMFPQQHSILVLTLRTGAWMTVDTGDHPTWYATWLDDRVLALLDPAHPHALAPTYTLGGKREGGTTLLDGTPSVPLIGSEAYGRVRTGPNDRAQAFWPGATIPPPPGRFSMTGDGQPASVSFCVSRRKPISELPPGA